MSENVDGRLRELRADEEKLNKHLTEWATEKLKPIYEAYPDAGKTIPAILFGMKYAQDLEGLEVWELAFMAMRAGLSGERNKASAIKRGMSLAPYVRLRHSTEAAREEALATLLEEVETRVKKMRALTAKSQSSMETENGNESELPNPVWPNVGLARRRKR